MSQVLGFDFGTHSIGVAVGQAITGTASPLAALKAKDGQPNWDLVAKLIQTWQPKLLVVGLPLNMDGSEQPLTDLARKFANRLHGRFGLPVELQDERLTTVAAKEELFARGGYRQLQKDKIDSAAAQLILEDYLSHQS
ncbi:MULTISPECIES: Holliday junction resolvase RuvX [Idiomarinaceae]|uniref:Putative pre-16S rRNA nuclease n=1 Tax=Pseudidiomarina sp. PP-1MA TaxID=3237706 RepID=A0AB39X846_9GAMM|nr:MULTISPECIES: Holliday junction resolvase RuvX [Idiomarina]MDX1525565.1 Holliday junction resolvase RuvX [Pseudidiomarina maritima]MRJ42479.1 Holliday junction resolvase RuvX [Idiomarina sp. FeN1]NCU58093.1 Holliday junction resolvase RuvX [Idiomarina sp. FenA--70]NCU60791.1 Holliday junction resolvase RuvX [Idiomarina sp. FenBw--71]UUN13722.1 Holliday junction resolvase RuvX [Idiomarina loihiensis]